MVHTREYILILAYLGNPWPCDFASPRPPGCYAARVILGRDFGAPAFATAEDAAWSLAPSCDGVEDAIHHRGQFYSITYSGVVEAWDQHDAAAKFTSTVVAPRLANEADDDSSRCRKYLVAAPGGRLMVVRKDSKEAKDEHRWGRMDTCSFKVHVLDGDGKRKVWKEAKDIGEAALLVGVNSALCVPTRELPEVKAAASTSPSTMTPATGPSVCTASWTAPWSLQIVSLLVVAVTVNWTSKRLHLFQRRLGNCVYLAYHLFYSVVVAPVIPK